ncbi:MAG TPA: rod shape-determining protein MreC [Parachlamydiaceae bacterium]|nr:rod shape-determining protein MreC [Parachlamydiaceae bacterium]
MSIPKESTVKLQGTTVAMLAPAWHHLLAFKSFFSRNDAAQQNQSAASLEEKEKLRLENTLLREEILYLKDVMQQELRLINQINTALHNEETGLSTKTLKARHRLELKRLLQVNLEAVPARVIFRSADSWNSSFWVNVGSATNESLGNTTVAKNSPVLLGTSVIGVLDYVGKNQSRVRLITDSGLTPSIRAVRGGIQSKVLDEKLNTMVQILKQTPNAMDTPEKQQELISQLEDASKHLSDDGKTNFLAKGELYGSSKPLWRTQRHQLKGTGFNYDFADGEGAARDLRTGNLSTLDPIESTPIVKVGDLLVTTGMDGVFPAGLMVAEVTKVHPLKEGDYFYELDALPIAGNFDDLSLVFIIPPVSYDPDEHPPAFGWK